MFHMFMWNLLMFNNHWQADFFRWKNELQSFTATFIVLCSYMKPKMEVEFCWFDLFFLCVVMIFNWVLRCVWRIHWHCEGRYKHHSSCWTAHQLQDYFRRHFTSQHYIVSTFSVLLFFCGCAKSPHSSLCVKNEKLWKNRNGINLSQDRSNH